MIFIQPPKTPTIGVGNMLQIQYLTLESGYIVYGCKDGQEVTGWWRANKLSDALDGLCREHPEFTESALTLISREEKEKLKEY